MMFRSAGQKAVEKLIEHVTGLTGKSEGSRETAMVKLLAEARDYVDDNEWGLAMETLLDSIYELDFKIDRTTIDLTKNAAALCQMDYTRFIFIEELVQ